MLQLLCPAGCSGASEGHAWHPRARQRLRCPGSAGGWEQPFPGNPQQSWAWPGAQPPQRLGEEFWQGSNRVPTGNQSPATLTRPRGKRCCWDPLVPPLLPCPTPWHPFLLPQWDEDGKTGWGLTFPQRTRLWRTRQVGMGSPSFQEEVTACTSPQKSGGTLSPGCHLRSEDL